MARTRGASHGVTHMDDGQLLDKEGKPINPVAHQVVIPATADFDMTEAREVYAEQLSGAENAPREALPAAPESYHCTMRTISKNIEGWEAVQLIDVLLGGIAMEITAEKYRELSADLRRHFMRGPLVAR